MGEERIGTEKENRNERRETIRETRETEKRGEIDI